MPSSKIGNENCVMATFDDVPKEYREAYERCKKEQVEKQMQGFLSCMDKDWHGVISVNKPVIFPSADPKTALRRASSDGVPPGFAIQGKLATINDERDDIGAVRGHLCPRGQTTLHHGPTAPRAESSTFLFGGARGRARV
jgi:hypothetical protein